MPLPLLFKLFLLCLLTLPLTAGAVQWQCRNLKREVLCGQSQCKASQDFTPIRVMFDSEAGVSVCAYSGCWQGLAELRSVKRFHKSQTYFARKLKWSSVGMDAEDFEITVPSLTKSGAGFVSGGGFAMPVHCERKN